MPMTPAKALGIPTVVGLLCTALSYGLGYVALSYLGQALMPESQAIWPLVLGSLLLASLGGTLGARFAFGRMKKQFEREQAEAKPSPAE